MEGYRVLFLENSLSPCWMHVSVTVLHVPHKEKCLYPAKAFPGNAAAFLTAWGGEGA